MAFSPHILTICLAAGLMLTPDTLVLFGNGLGVLGPVLLLALPLAVLVHMGTLQSFRELHETSGDPVVGFQRMLGNRAASIALLLGKLPFAICASAGLVVTAGFVFNEVFVYWFPNFTFAYLLLAAVLVINVFRPSAVPSIQVVSIALAGSGLFVLTVAGILNPADTGSTPGKSIGMGYRFLAAAVIVLVGFDMGYYSSRNARPRPTQTVRALMIALVAGGALLALWGLAAMSLVSSAKLESSTIPHMIVARKALGQPGRIIMGAVAISGVFAAVNAMMYSISSTTAKLAGSFGGPNASMSAGKVRVITLLIMAGTSAFLMLLGFAGEPVLETWIRGGMVLWLIYYMVINVAAYRIGRAPLRKRDEDRKYPLTLLKGFAFAGAAFGAAGLVLIEPEPKQMVMFLVTVTAAVTMLVAGVGYFVLRDDHQMSKEHSRSVHP